MRWARRAVEPCSGFRFMIATVSEPKAQREFDGV